MVNKLYQSYYTKSEPILEYMTRQLKLEEGLRILDPAAGDGVFIQAILDRQPATIVDAFDLNPEAVAALENQFVGLSNVQVVHTDTLMGDPDGLFSGFTGQYDRVIANPPYGAWQEYSKREHLKRLYKGLYVKETYALFLYRSLQLLKEGGRLVFIIPDTYLNLHTHGRLRELLLSRTKIIEIALFPSSFFPGVKFGYSNLSILTLQKCSNATRCLKNTFRVLTDFPDVHALAAPTGSETTYTFQQQQVYESIDHALFVCSNPQVTSLINRAQTRIADVADCVTGIYSGNDKRFLYALSCDIRNGARYQTVPQDCVFHTSQETPLGGIQGKRHFVPIVKGGGVKYFKPDLWFLDWSVEAVRHYHTSPKARFQNSRYYFKPGLSVPMVSSRHITAAIMRDRLFDQSIVGIFPRRPDLTYFLLGFFNSPTCNTLIRTINPSANNPANYIKKLPFIEPPPQVLHRIDGLIGGIVRDIQASGSYEEENEREVHRMFADLYGM